MWSNGLFTFGIFETGFSDSIWISDDKPSSNRHNEPLTAAVAQFFRL